MENLASAIERLRSARERLGWSTAEVASRVRRFSEELGEPIGLKQQTVSYFETGKAKSIPRWMHLFALLTDLLELPEHSQREIIEDFRRPAMPEWLNDPAKIKSAKVDDPDADVPAPTPLTSDERELVDHFTGLSPADRRALLQVARSMASGPPAAATVHSKGDDYSAEAAR